MAMPSRDEILNEIRRTAEANDGKPLGISRFEQETGISRYAWGRYWSRFGDAQQEAGFAPNTLNAGYGPEALIVKYIALIRELGRLPTKGDLQVKNTLDRSFPAPTTYATFARKSELVRMVLEYCGDNPEYADVVELCAAYPRPGAMGDGLRQLSEGNDSDLRAGFVYLIKGHRNEYKLGHTSVVDRRLSELATGSSADLAVVHEIKTDDPLGVEAYWHRRFEKNRIKNEWFKLTAADVRAFKRWRRIF